MYVELDHFIFIDYLLVTIEARGQGLGHKLSMTQRKREANYTRSRTG